MCAVVNECFAGAFNGRCCERLHGVNLGRSAWRVDGLLVGHHDGFQADFAARFSARDPLAFRPVSARFSLAPAPRFRSLSAGVPLEIRSTESARYPLDIRLKSARPVA